MSTTGTACLYSVRGKTDICISKLYAAKRPMAIHSQGTCALLFIVLGNRNKTKLANFIELHLHDRER